MVVWFPIWEIVLVVQERTRSAMADVEHPAPRALRGRTEERSFFGDPNGLPIDGLRPHPAA